MILIIVNDLAMPHRLAIPPHCPHPRRGHRIIPGPGAMALRVGPLWACSVFPPPYRQGCSQSSEADRRQHRPRRAPNPGDARRTRRSEERLKPTPSPPQSSPYYPQSAPHPPPSDPSSTTTNCTTASPPSPGYAAPASPFHFRPRTTTLAHSSRRAL